MSAPKWLSGSRKNLDITRVFGSHNLKKNQRKSLVDSGAVVCVGCPIAGAIVGGIGGGITGGLAGWKK